MQIYHLILDGDLDYGAVAEMVVLADDPRMARRVASENAGEEGENAWLDQDAVACVRLGDAHGGAAQRYAPAGGLVCRVLVGVED